MTTQATPPPPIRRPYRSLDAWRGLAALAVLFHHASSSVIIHRPAVTYDPVHLVCWYAYLGVQMFFVISGYCIANAAAVTLERRQSVGVYAMARVRRIYPTFWIATIVWLGLNQFMQYMMRRHYVSGSIAAAPIDFSLKFWLGNLTLFGQYFNSPPAVGQAWTLCYEVSFYAIVGIAFVLANGCRVGSRGMLMMLHVTTLGCIVAMFIWKASVPFPVDLYAHFGLGVMVFDCVMHRSRLTYALFFGAIALLLIHVLLFNYDLGTNPNPSREINLGAAVFALIAWCLAPADERLSKTWVVRALAMVGGFSYTLYLMHFYVIGMESQVLLRKAFFINHDYLTLVVTAVAALIICWALYFVAERPFLRKRKRTREDLPEALGVVPPSDASTAVPV